MAQAYRKFPFICRTLNPQKIIHKWGLRQPGATFVCRNHISAAAAALYHAPGETKIIK